MLGQVRRLVTGHDADGKAIFVEDGAAPVVHTFERRPGAAITELWKTTATPAPLGSDPDLTAGPMKLQPAAGGSVFRIVTMAPETAEVQARLAQDPKSAFGDIGAKTASTFKAGGAHPMMHRTETIDYGLVLEGEVYAVLEDSERLMKAGDVIVQRGTNHAWSNRSGKPCKMAFILIDGVFDADLAARLA